MPAGTYPNTTSKTLHVKFGFVGSGAISASSANLAMSAPLFQASDVGNLVMVFGAGGSGGPLFSPILTFTDSQHVTLTGTASTGVSATSENVIVFREKNSPTDSIQIQPTGQALTFRQTLQARDTFSFSLQSLHAPTSPATTFSPAVGQPVLLVDDNLGEIFGGTIDQVMVRALPGGVGIINECQGVTYDLLLYRQTTKLPTGPGSPPQPNAGAFTGQTLGQIATYLVGLAAADGVTIQTVSGPVIPSFLTNFATLGDGLDQICKLASNAISQYQWYTDTRRVVHVVQIGTVAAPFNISYTSNTDTDTVLNDQYPVTVTYTRQNYVNRANVRVGNLSQGTTTEQFTGNGTETVFETAFNLQSAPQISLLTTSPVSSVPQTVGVLGIDSGKQWYWQLNSNVITADPSTPAPASNQILQVIFQGVSLGVVIETNSAAIALQAAVEGGTGIYEAVVDAGTPATLADAQTLGLAIANSQGIIPATVGCSMYKGGLAVGQTVRIDILQIGVSDNFVVDSVTMALDDNLVRWDITATRGPMVLNFTNMLQGIIQAPTSSVASGVPAFAAEPIVAITPVRQFISDTTNGPNNGNNQQPVPFRYNNRLYYVGPWTTSGTHHYSVFESTDDGRTWTALDDSNAPAATSGITGCCAFDGAVPAQQGAGGYLVHTFWVAATASGPPTHDVTYQSFNLGTRTWNTASGAIGPAATFVIQCFIRQHDNRLFVTYDAGSQSIPSVESRFQGISYDLNAQTFGHLAVDIGAEFAIGTGNGNTIFSQACCGVIDNTTGRLHFFLVSTNFGTWLWQAIETNDSRGSFFFFITLGLGPPLGNFWLPGSNAIILNGRLVIGVVTKEGGPTYNYRLLVSADLVEADLTSASNWATTPPIAAFNANQFVDQGSNAFPSIAGDLRGILMLIHSLDNTTFIDKISYCFTIDTVGFTSWSQLTPIWDLNVDIGPPPADNGFLNEFGINELWLSRDITDAARSRAFVMMTPKAQSAGSFLDCYVGYVEWDAVAPV